jgi:hypothetical protein
MASFFICLSSPQIWATLAAVKKWIGLHFGRFFSQTHLVALKEGQSEHSSPYVYLECPYLAFNFNFRSSVCFSDAFVESDQGD